MDANAPLGFDDELLAEFVNESREHLTSIETDLLAIEANGADIDLELVNKVFRAAHSIKGASSFFGLNKVKELAHKAETVLEMIRSRKMAPNAEITNILLAAFDKLRQMINNPGETMDADISELVQGLTALASSYLPQEKKAALIETITLSVEQSDSRVSLSRFDYEQALEQNKLVYFAECDLIHDVERQGLTVPQLFHALFDCGDVLNCEVAFEAVGTLEDAIIDRLPLRFVLASASGADAIRSRLPRNFGKLLLLSDTQAGLSTDPQQQSDSASRFESSKRAKAATKRSQAPTRPEAKGGSKSDAAPKRTSTAVEESIRVNVETLETLMNLTGELVLGRNQLRASLAQNDAQALSAADQRINQIATELQDAVMQARLQPIGNVFGKFPRLVRDLAASLQKEIQLDILGKDVALDRTLIESLADPLTHMVRNAVDHGIESTADRVAAGKPRQGQLTISARHEAGQVVVEIVDDGRGIDPERIGKAALAKGLITAEKLESMSAKDKTSLVFLPGFSTSAEVSEISGRGVGMDVVKTNLDHLGGKVEIISTPGQGTTFRVKVPLTLAIIPCLIVSVEGERFAIPQINVEEMRRVRAGDPTTRVERLGDAEVLVLRDELIPLIRFEQILRAEVQDDLSPRSVDDTRDPSDGSTRGELEIVVVSTGTLTYGLAVSRFHHTEEIVVKPLGVHLKGIEEYAGATILGDGSVALIVDIAGLATKERIDAIDDSSSLRESRKTSDEEAALRDLHSLVLFHNGEDVPCAVHSDTVKRIERIQPHQIETIAGRRSMQYNGGMLPLVTLADTANVDQIPSDCDAAVIIANIRGHEVGLLAAMPIDVVEESSQIDHSTHRQKGIAGSAAIRGRTTLIVDLYELVDTVWPEWAVQQANGPRTSPTEPALTVLLAEDSDFFRAQIKRFLIEDGYSVLDAPDGEAAWELLLSNSEQVRAVVTDIEMPRLDGLGLVRRIREDKRTMELPVIALTSLAADEDVKRGKAAGVSEYQTKLDREQLLGTLHRYATPASHAPVAM